MEDRVLDFRCDLLRGPWTAVRLYYLENALKVGPAPVYSTVHQLAQSQRPTPRRLDTPAPPLAPGILPLALWACALYFTHPKHPTVPTTATLLYM